jgi:diacylglycerol O-acyltransferase
MRQLSGSDAFFLYADKPGRHQHLSTIYLYDPSSAKGEVNFQRILEHVRDRIGTSRIFRQRLVQVPMNVDYPYWIHDEHFDLEFHVRHIALPKPGDWRQFCILASRLHARPVDMHRPVWEMYVIDGLDNISWLPEGAFAVLVKVHHVALDDVTEDDFTIALHDLEAEPESEEVSRRWFSEKEPGAMQLLALAWFNNTIKLVETGQSLFDRIPGIGANPLKPDDVLHFDQASAPKTRFDGRVSPHRVLAPFTFGLTDLELINDALPDATLNDVILAVCGGALQHYLADKNELPRRSLYALVPLHVHHQDDEGVPGHRVQLVRIRLMTNVEDPMERLAMVREEMQEARALKPISAQEMADMQDVLPSAAMTLAARAIGAGIGPGKRFRDNHNTVVSIHPGPSRPLYLCGSRLVGYTSMGALMDNLGLNHTATIYDGKVTVAPVCDRRMMPDPAFYYECLRDSFEALLSAARDAVERASPKRRYAVARKRADSSTAAKVLSE